MRGIRTGAAVGRTTAMRRASACIALGIVTIGLVGCGDETRTVTVVNSCDYTVLAGVSEPPELFYDPADVQRVEAGEARDFPLHDPATTEVVAVVMHPDAGEVDRDFTFQLEDLKSPDDGSYVWEVAGDVCPPLPETAQDGASDGSG